MIRFQIVFEVQLACERENGHAAEIRNYLVSFSGDSSYILKPGFTPMKCVIRSLSGLENGRSRKVD